MRKKRIAALAAAIAFLICGCSETGTDVVINVDEYGGIAFMMEQSAISAMPIPPIPIEPIYTETGNTAEETDIAENTAEETTVVENTENTDESSSEQTDIPTAEEPPEITWTETPLKSIMYVNTEGISSRAKAIMGSEKANRFGLNQEVTVTAKTNTNYYKLDNGTYIHSDYLSAYYVAETTVRTTVTTAEPKTEPPKTKPPETEPPVTVAPETVLPETGPNVTEPNVTEVSEAEPSTTVTCETLPPETSPPTTEAPQKPPSNVSKYSAEILKNEKETYLKGIDVSWAQGEINWEAVSKSGIDFVYIRAGRGDIDGKGPKADNCFLRNIREANKYGIDVGVYFYSYALTKEEARAEAKLTLELIQGYKVTYPVVFDLEEWMDRSNLADIAEAYMETIANGGYYPMLYSYRYGVDSFSKEFKKKYALWIAQRNDRPVTDYDYYIWQYSFTGQVSGIKGNVDLDISFRNFPEILKKYGLNKLS